MKIIISLILSILLNANCFSQQKSKPIARDCKKAILLNLNNSYSYGVTQSTSGFGDIQEIKGLNKNVFEKEHNTAWYLLTLQRDGELVFDITPEDSTNDYDFLLYNYIDTNFCDLVSKNKLLPVRSNLSNNIKIKGRTGLKSSKLLNTFTGEGPGKSYSKSIGVKKDEKYMLVLDNVALNGKGHTIKFAFTKDVKIMGTIINSDSLPVIADVILTDVEGTVVSETKSNKNGEYTIKTTLKENENHSLTYIGENEFVKTVLINTKNLKENNSFPNIKTVLSKLKKGEKYKLGNINFYGDLDKLLPESYSSVEALAKLMKKNKKLEIQIEGHVNAPYNMEHDNKKAYFNQTLSEKRALTIYNYLIKQGISQNRITYIGLSNKFPLYKTPQDEFQSQANRRVEIKVVSFD